jgi:hypothetical protein
MSSFWGGFEKQALVGGPLMGGALGAVGGGEKNEYGNTKNRGTGALRGAATGLGAELGMLAGQLASGKAEGAVTMLGALAGMPIGYLLAKHLGPKYDKEKKPS